MGNVRWSVNAVTMCIRFDERLLCQRVTLLDVASGRDNYRKSFVLSIHVCHDLVVTVVESWHRYGYVRHSPFRLYGVHVIVIHGTEGAVVPLLTVTCTLRAKRT